MGKNFAAFRKKTRAAAVITSVILGIGVAAIILASMILVVKLSAGTVTYVHYLIGAAAAAVLVPLFILFLLPSDKRIARRLDSEHGLKEKVSTMVEFRDSEEPFAKLQREDADERLGRIKLAPWRKKQLVSVLIVFFLSAALLVSAFVIPGSASGEEPEQPLSEFDKQWILAELSDITALVEKSFEADGLKAATLSELSVLVKFVEEHEYLSEMKLQAIKTVINVNSRLKSENTAVTVGEKLAEARTEEIKSLGNELLKLNGTGAQKGLGSLMTLIEGASLEDASYAADEISAAINSSGADNVSPLVMSLKNLASAIQGYSNEEISSVSEAFGSVKTDVMNQVMVQNMNKLTTGQVTSRLSSLFGISEKELVEAGADPDIEVTPPGYVSGGEKGEGKDESDQIESGGIGTGDRIYGSNDMIYDPYQNKYVPYGQLLDEYNDKAIQLIKDGKTPPDFEEFVEDYFMKLSDYKPEE